MRIRLHVRTNDLNPERQRLYYDLFKYEDPVIESDYEPEKGDVITLADDVYPPDNVDQYIEKFGTTMRLVVMFRELWFNRDLRIADATYCCRLLTEEQFWREFD